MPELATTHTLAMWLVEHFKICQAKLKQLQVKLHLVQVIMDCRSHLANVFLLLCVHDLIHEDIPCMIDHDINLQANFVLLVEL